MTTPASRADVLRRAVGASEDWQPWQGGAQLRLDRADTVWLIGSGDIDVFYVGASDVESPSGSDPERRQHIMHLSAGDALFGFRDEAPVIAVPTRSCELLPVDRRSLLASASEGAAKQMLAACVDRWFEAFAQACQSAVIPRSHLAMIADRHQVEVDPSMLIQAYEQPVWIRSDGELRLDGAQALDVRDIPFPLAWPAWVEATQQGTVEGLSTADILGDGHAAVWLDAAQQTYLGCFTAKAESEYRDAIDSVDKREASQKQRFSAVLGGLAAVAGAGETPGVIEDLSSDLLITACQYVAADMDITIAVPRDSEALAQSTDPLGSIARVSGFRTRMIRLSGEWWKEDHGPVLAFRADGLSPCALISHKTGSYELIDPQTHEATPVDRNVASTLSPHAFMFYTPFPAGPIGIREMLRAGLKGSSRDGWVIAAMVLLAGVLSMAMPLVTEQVMSKVIPEAEYGQLLILGIALIVIALSSTLFSLVQSIAVLRIEGMMDNRLQSSVWDRLLRLPSSFFRKFTVGDLLNRASGIDGIRHLLTSSAISSVIAAVTGMFSLALMFYYDVILAVVVSLFSIAVGGFSYLMGRKAIAKNKEYLERQADVSTDVLQYLNAISKLRVSGVESEAFVLWARKYALAELVGIEQKGKINTVAVANAVFTYIAIASVLAVIGMQGHQLFAFFSVPKSWHAIDAATLTHVMPAAIFIAFNAAYGQFSTAVSQLANQGVTLYMMKPLYDRLRPVLDAEEENSKAAVDPGELSGSIEIHDVHFRYNKDGPPVLQGLSMQVEPGSFVALVGPSGAGKSSLLRLLLVFDSPEAGSIFLDDQDIAQLDAQALRRNFGVVLQNGQLFAGSIFDNITAGSNLSMDDAWWAARMSGLDQDIEKMPMGMHTVLSEGAGTLSGGQRQRLMIARAIVHRPRILIFDEATSALDNETQAIVSRSLESLNCTRIAIAHRLSTIQQADNIFVVDAGRVVESGDYNSLMEKKGVFFNLARRQIA